MSLRFTLHVLAHGHSLLDEAVEVLGEGGREALALQDAEDLGVGDGGHLSNAVVITEKHANLGRGRPFFAILAMMSFTSWEVILSQEERSACRAERNRSCPCRSVHATHVCLG